MRKILSLVTGLVLLLAAFVVAAEPAKTNLRIEGMTCGGCAAAVRLHLKRTEGVTAYDVSYENKRAEVTYDPARTTPQKIADAVAKTGYRVTVIGAAPAAAPAASVEMPVVGPDGLRDWFKTADRSRSSRSCRQLVLNAVGAAVC